MDHQEAWKEEFTNSTTSTYNSPTIATTLRGKVSRNTTFATSREDQTTSQLPSGASNNALATRLKRRCESSRIYSHIRIANNTQNSHNPTVLCFIMTYSEYHSTRIKDVLETWGPKCDRLVIASDVEDPTVGSIQIQASSSYWNLWYKLGETVNYIYNHYPGYDWYLKADDDTFVIMENLKAFLAKHHQHHHQQQQANNSQTIKEPKIFGRLVESDFTVDQMQTDPLYFGNRANQDFGRRFAERIPGDTKIVYPHGGPGYIMNWEYLKRLNQAMHSNDTFVKGRQPEDMAQGTVMLYQGLYPTNTLDERGRDYQHWDAPSITLRNHEIPDPQTDTRPYGPRTHMRGFDCCAPYSISFHHVIRLKNLQQMLYDCPKLPFQDDSTLAR